MDSYSFANAMGFFKVARTTRETFVGTYLYRRNKEGQEVLLEECSVTGAEILRLAEDKKRLREARLEAERDRDAAREALRGTQKQVRGLEADLAIARARVEQAERRAEDLFDADAVLADHHQGDEAPADTLRRIIRERKLAVQQEAAQRQTTTVYRNRWEDLCERFQSAESANRQHCLELAEKAGEIQTLTVMLQARQDTIDRLYRELRFAVQVRANGRLAKLLALLDSEEPPKEWLNVGGPGAGPLTAWRWLREQVGERHRPTGEPVEQHAFVDNGFGACACLVQTGAGVARCGRAAAHHAPPVAPEG